MINIEDFWEDAKNELSISIQAISYEVWIEKLEPVCFVDNAIVLSTISANAKRTIDTRYRDTIKEVVSSLNSSITDVIITTPDKKNEWLNKQTVFIKDEGFVTNEPSKEKGKKKSPKSQLGIANSQSASFLTPLHFYIQSPFRPGRPPTMFHLQKP